MTKSTYFEVNDVSPQILEHFIGQKHVINQVKVALEASWTDGIRFPNSLLAGISGGGKTQLSQIISREMGIELKEQLAQNLVRPAELRGFLLEGKDKDVLLIDELHELPKTVQVTLYRALENRKIFINSNLSKKTYCINLANFSLLGATTDPHLLLKPLRDRFRLILNFSWYDNAELELILRNRCKQLGWDVSEDVFPLVATCGRGTPRIALRFLESIRRTARSENASSLTVEHFHKTKELEGLIGEYGLNRDDYKYLTILSESKDPIRLNIIATRLGIQSKSVAEVIEPFLIRIGFVMKDDKGRFMTEAGLRYIENNPL